MPFHKGNKLAKGKHTAHVKWFKGLLFIGCLLIQFIEQ